MSSITAKVAEWQKSPEGKKRIENAILNIVVGIAPKHPNQNVVTFDTMNKLADILIQNIKDLAYERLPSYNAINSVGGALEGLTHTKPISIGRGMYSIDIYFDNESDLYRPSLRPDIYPSGAYDIVSLFELGYSTKDDATVSGVWHGKQTVSTPHREGLHFMRDAVDAYNIEYGDLYYTNATLNI